MDFKLIKRIITTRRHVRNWITVASFLAVARGNHQKQFVLRFRNGVNIEELFTRKLVWNLIQLCEYSRVLNVEIRSDLIQVKILAKQIIENLQQQFSASEINEGGTGGWVAEKEMLLFSLIRKFRPKMVIETGVGQGISSTFILKALQLNGEGALLSIDLPNRNPDGYVYPDGTKDSIFLPKDLEPGWIVPPDLRSRWSLRIGASADILPGLKTTFEIFFHDSEHSYQNMIFEFTWADAHLQAGGILVSDDVNWNNSWRDFIATSGAYIELIQDESVGVIIKK